MKRVLVVLLVTSLSVFTGVGLGKTILASSVDDKDHPKVPTIKPGQKKGPRPEVKQLKIEGKVAGILKDDPCTNFGFAFGCPACTDSGYLGPGDIKAGPYALTPINPSGGVTNPGSPQMTCCIISHSDGSRTVCIPTASGGFPTGTTGIQIDILRSDNCSFDQYQYPGTTGVWPPTTTKCFNYIFWQCPNSGGTGCD